MKNRVVFITGSAERVGKHIALFLAQKGASVVIHYHTKKEKARQTAQEIAQLGTPPLVVQGDISSAADWERMRDTILQHHGRIDVLVNNAAIFYKTPFLDSDEKDWDRFMNVNLKSVYLGSRIIGAEMVRQKSGKIINIADVSAYTIWPQYIPYCVSKAGVIALTRGLAKALAPHVLVNAIAPGTILLAEQYDEEEEMALIQKTPLKRIGDPQDIAATVAFLIEGSDFITGAVINVDGGRSLT
ncbi:MAG: SDR family oxidoreductase [Calditrichaeota bacterium]|nr:SDR family oxidoreductase [Calditrichota bacterium]